MCLFSSTWKMKMMTLYHHLIQRETSGLTFLKIVLILKVMCFHEEENARYVQNEPI